MDVQEELTWLGREYPGLLSAPGGTLLHLAALFFLLLVFQPGAPSTPQSLVAALGLGCLGSLLLRGGRTILGAGLPSPLRLTGELPAILRLEGTGGPILVLRRHLSSRIEARRHQQFVEVQLHLRVPPRVLGGRLRFRIRAYPGHTSGDWESRPLLAKAEGAWRLEAAVEGPLTAVSIRLELDDAAWLRIFDDPTTRPPRAGAESAYSYLTVALELSRPQGGQGQLVAGKCVHDQVRRLEYLRAVVSPDPDIQLQAGTDPGALGTPPSSAGPTPREVTGSRSGCCEICGDPLEAELVACSSCGTPAHRDCWDFADGCPVYACRGSAREI
jgi:hypothetical protein